MNKPTKKIYEVASNPWFIFITGACSIVALVGWFYDKYNNSTSKAANARAAFDAAVAYAGDPGTLILAVAVIFFLAGTFYSLRVRWENSALRKIPELLYEINVLYKTELQKNFFGEKPNSQKLWLLEAELRILTAVCQRIGKIYTMAVGRPCLITIKLIKKEGEKFFATTYVRSEGQCFRDEVEPKLFALDTGQNTCYDAATRPTGSGLPTHFFSANLHNEEKYCSQRQHYLQHYKSILVVPIRGNTVRDDSRQLDLDLVGFLAVDTMSTNRLNDRYHLYILAAMAHQMYNFISLMRGRYKVFVGDE